MSQLTTDNRGEVLAMVTRHLAIGKTGEVKAL
jgi:hypothetical protein